MGARFWFFTVCFGSTVTRVLAGAPTFPAVDAAVQSAIETHEISGAVTVVVTKDKVLHLAAAGRANIETKKSMEPDTLFWIASMTKPITGVSILLLQDEGRLALSDPVAKYLPEFAALKTPSGEPARVTIAQLLTHTSGLGEASEEGALNAHILADLIPLFVAAPMQYEPGARWKFTQSGINTAARIVEVASGLSFDEFVQKRILDPLEMNHSTFYPTEKPQTTRATPYLKNRDNGALQPAPPRPEVGQRERPPLGNSGLFSTAPDYARFCQMLLNQGVVAGRRFLSPEAFSRLTTVQTGDLPCGFFRSEAFGSRGANYGWGMGMCILRTPHAGVAAMLSPGSFGHGGGWGTQAWIDPVRGVAYILMVQRTNFDNSDNSELRRAFQQAAADTLIK